MISIFIPILSLVQFSSAHKSLLHSVLLREDKILLLKATNYTHSQLPFGVYWCLQLGGEQDSFKVLLLLFQKFTFRGQVLDATMHPAVSMSWDSWANIKGYKTMKHRRQEKSCWGMRDDSRIKSSKVVFDRNMSWMFRNVHSIYCNILHTYVI